MLQFIYGRGYGSGADISLNNSFYLYSGIWYRTFSPNNLFTNNHTNVIRVHTDGSISGNWVDDENGGVRIFRVMLNIF